MNQRRILVVEDEEHLAEGIKFNLECEGYRAEIETNGLEALNRLRDEEFDLIILDVMLPGIDGFEVCKKLRANDDRTPILFLTARKSSEDRVTGLTLGGDDYMPKPFNLKELLARVQAILRRRAWTKADRELKEISFGPYTVNFTRMESEGPKGKLRLNRRESLILKLLAERKGEPVSRNEILDRAWGTDRFPTDRTIDNFIVKLRQMFEDNPRKPRYIRTVRGIGYRLDMEG